MTPLTTKQPLLKERRIMAKSTIAHTEHIFQEPIQRVFHKPEPPGVRLF